MRNHIWIYYNTWRCVNYMVKGPKLYFIWTNNILHRNLKLSDLLYFYLKLHLVWKYAGQT